MSNSKFSGQPYYDRRYAIEIRDIKGGMWLDARAKGTVARRS
jgi:hypothetical protein